MRRILLLACLIVVLSGCATGQTKRFTVIVDPPDARITLLPGNGQEQQQYRSPADIAVTVPKPPSQAAGRLMIEREKYKPISILLSNIHTDTLKLKMDKAVQYRLKFRMIRPIVSDDLIYRDRTLTLQFFPGERNFQLKIENLTSQPLAILWDRTNYVDVANRTHKLMRTELGLEERRQASASQTIPAGDSVLTKFVPADNRSQPLFILDEGAIALKGTFFNLFLPIEQDRAISPQYNFWFEIVDVVRE